MFAATADQFVAEMRHELWWLRAARWIAHPDRETDRRWKILRWPLRVLIVPLFLIYAQVLPFLVDRLVQPIVPKLPWVTDRDLLARVEDLFRLLYELLRDFGRWSLAKKTVAYWLEELDEQLDSLEFAREHGAEIQSAIDEARTHHACREHA